MPNIARTIVIGDLQGCFASLQALLKAAAVDLTRDRVWLVGDLVNRGPASLEVLRWVKASAGAVQTVLGNHDLHLLGCIAGVRSMKPGDTLADVMSAPDRGDIVEWLRQQPLAIFDTDYALVHAGFHPSWPYETAKSLARRASDKLRGDKWREFLGELFSFHGAWDWNDGENERSALAVMKAVKIMTTMRCLKADGALDDVYNGPANVCPLDIEPWYLRKRSSNFPAHIIFGHWASLGLLQTDAVTCLDSGCVWGRQLSAMDLATREVWSVPCADKITYEHRP